MASKPIHPHTVITMIEYSAPFELVKNPNGPRPTLPEEPVREPEVRVEEPEEHDRRRDRGHDHRDEHRESVQAHPADPSVQGDGREQPAADRERHEQRRIDHGVDHRRLEQRILRERPVVGEPDPLRRRQQVRLLERHQRRPHDRHDAERDDQRHGGERERPADHVVGPHDPADVHALRASVAPHG